MKYNKKFYQNQTSRNAKIIVPIILQYVKPKSVLDVGCGVGYWLAEFKKYGLSIKGIDGHYVPSDEIVIPEKAFIRRDLSEGLSLQQSMYDMILCLEVMEHLPNEQSDQIIKRMTELTPVIVFSAAIPGQGGTHHINEQWQSYWSNLFKKYGYVRIDCLRKELWDRDIEFCYKQNIFFYVDFKLISKYPDLESHITSTEYVPCDIVHPQLYRHENIRSISLKRALGTILFLPRIILNSRRHKQSESSCISSNNNK